MLEKQGGVPMSNEETILRELKQCYYSEGEELTYKKDKFLMEMLVARIAGLFDEKHQYLGSNACQKSYYFKIMGTVWS